MDHPGLVCTGDNFTQQLLGWDARASYSMVFAKDLSPWDLLSLEAFEGYGSPQLLTGGLETDIIHMIRL